LEAVILADFTCIFADFSTSALTQPLLGLHPACHGLSRLVLEGIAESAVIVEATLQGQLLGGEGLLGGDSLAVEAHEVVDALTVDVGIVGCALA
jgi:hypothetical protein